MGHSATQVVDCHVAFRPEPAAVSSTVAVLRSLVRAHHLCIPCCVPPCDYMECRCSCEQMHAANAVRRHRAVCHNNTQNRKHRAQCFIRHDARSKSPHFIMLINARAFSSSADLKLHQCIHRCCIVSKCVSSSLTRRRYPQKTSCAPAHYMSPIASLHLIAPDYARCYAAERAVLHTSCLRC